MVDGNAQMARLAAGIMFQEALKRATTAMAPLNTGGGDTPIFWVHSISGKGTDPIRLSRSLGPTQPFYSVRAPSRLRTHEGGRSVDELATLYVSELSKVHPAGPLILGAFSAGVVVAYEMAQQLRAVGRDIDLFVAVDFAPFNTPLARGFLGEAIHQLAYSARQVRAEGTLAGPAQRAKSAIVKRLKYLVRDQPLERLLWRIPLRDPENAFVRSLYYAVEAYVPARLHCPVVLYLARKIHDTSLAERWATLVADLTTVRVEGDHAGLLMGNGLPGLAGDLRDKLRQLRAFRSMVEPYGL